MQRALLQFETSPRSTWPIHLPRLWLPSSGCVRSYLCKRATSLPRRMISGAGHAAVPTRQFCRFPANLRLGCSRSAAISVFTYILLTGTAGSDLASSSGESAKPRSLARGRCQNRARTELLAARTPPRGVLSIGHPYAIHGIATPGEFVYMVNADFMSQL